MPGILLAALLTAVLCGRLIGSGGTRRLLDAFSPGLALGMGIIYLSDRFGTAARSKMVFPLSGQTYLPFFVAEDVNSGTYRLAVYFVLFAGLFIIFLLTSVFYIRHNPDYQLVGSYKGATFILFMLLLSALEVVCDSMRYDSSYFRSNGFVSIIQVGSALCFLAVVIFYSIRSVKGNGFRFYHPIIWGFFIAGFGGAIYMEYLVQRHTDWYVRCYVIMSICCVVMALCGYILHLTNHADIKKDIPQEKECMELLAEGVGAVLAGMEEEADVADHKESVHDEGDVPDDGLETSGYEAGQLKALMQESVELPGKEITAEAAGVAAMPASEGLGTIAEMSAAEDTGSEAENYGYETETGLSVRYNILTAEEFLILWNSVWTSAPSLAQTSLALEHSLFRVSVYDGDKVVAMARVIGDMGMCYYIKDVIVRPEYQGQKIGSLLIDEILKFVHAYGVEGTKIAVELSALPDKVPFYEKFGFKSNEAKRLRIMYKVE
jgi:ribosomal protein S18 acetylase RimI-like enzyme